MAKIYSKALEKEIEVDRLIGKVDSGKPGPTIIFTGGIHGNEPSGIFALKQVLNKIEKDKLSINGTFYAISGNLWALERGERFQKHDLNRLWAMDRMNLLKSNQLVEEDEDTKQQIEIYNLISGILEDEKGPFYFIDLHTTSSETMPFLTVNDSLLNRKFTEQYPVPMILGIEEYLDGPLLSYINELGYIAFGFEGGEHDDLASIENHEAFVWLSMVFSGSVAKESIDYNHYHGVLAKSCVDTQDIFEIYFRHEIKKGDEFRMNPGFVNFQPVEKGQSLAVSNGEELKARESHRIFMPLYQSQGNDGYFSIRRIPNFFLKLSATLRKYRTDRLLVLLPGVKWASNEHKDVLIVNARIARFFTKKFFHLLGYRSQNLEDKSYIMKNREAASKTKEYQ